MTPEEDLQLREQVQRLYWLGPELDRTRLDELRDVDGKAALEALMPAFEAAAKLPPRKTSGLVEQQAIFKKAHKKK